MGFVRFIGRSALASYFIVNGVRSVGAPDEQVQAATPLTNRFVPLAQSIAPDSVTLPSDPVTIVRAGGAAQVVGGLALATGVGRRLGATTLLATVLPRLWASLPTRFKDLSLKEASSGNFVKNLALAGALLIAATDTEGKPSLAWRAQDQANRLAQAAALQQRYLERSLAQGNISRKAKKTATKRSHSNLSHRSAQTR